jgi:5-methylcytosine-specific restriction enzyme A
MPWRPPVHRPRQAVLDSAAAKHAYEQRRGSASSRGYGRAWQKLRAAFLAQNPTCKLCEQAGRLTAAEVVDHIRPHKGDPELQMDWDNLQSLCTPCHARKTNRDGSIGTGFGHMKRNPGIVL